MLLIKISLAITLLVAVVGTSYASCKEAAKGKGQ